VKCTILFQENGHLAHKGFSYSFHAIRVKFVAIVKWSSTVTISSYPSPRGAASCTQRMPNKGRHRLPLAIFGRLLSSNEPDIALEEKHGVYPERYFVRIRREVVNVTARAYLIP
jgi:hypothetical protein